MSKTFIVLIYPYLNPFVPNALSLPHPLKTSENRKGALGTNGLILIFTQPNTDASNASIISSVVFVA